MKQMSDNWGLLIMELTDKFVITPAIQAEPRRSVLLFDIQIIGIVVTTLLGIALLVGMVQYNLSQVPSSEVDRIYKNAGSAVKRTFR